MRFSILGDHSKLHSGCKAVIDALKQSLQQHGEIVDDGQDYDALIVNGEGSMHHSSSHCAAKMQSLHQAQMRGKKTWLINSVWQDNIESYNSILARLDGVALRGPASAEDMATNNELKAGFGLDLSYYAPVDTVPAKIDYNNDVIVSDFWSSDVKTFVRPSSSFLSEYPYFDLAQDDWSGVIASLKTSRLLITGRHHAMYAACKARLPFVVIAGNSHKFEDLLKQAPCSIPVCRNRSEIQAALTWSLQNSDEFHRLFDWMEAQTPWDIKSGPTTQFPKTFQTLKRIKLDARAANISRDGETAEKLWRLAGTLGMPKEQVTERIKLSLIQARNIPQAAMLITESRLRDSANFDLIYEYNRLITPQQSWVVKAGDPKWWQTFLKARVHLESDNKQLFLDIIKAEMLSLKDAISRETMRQLVLAWLAKAIQWQVSDEVNSVEFADDTPEAFKIYDHAFHCYRRARYRPEDIETAQNLFGNPQTPPTLRTLMRDYIGYVLGPSHALLASAISDLGHIHDPSGRLLAQAVSLSFQMEDYDSAMALVQRFKPKSVARYLPLTYCLEPDADESRLFQEALKYSTFLEEHLSKAKSFAIVGNGTIDPSARLGAIIDKQDVVIRFNNFILSPDANGSKTDLVSMALGPRDQAEYVLKGDIPLGVMAIPTPWGLRSKDWRMMVKLRQENRPISFISNSVDCELTKYLMCRPSSGILMVALIYRLCGYFNADWAFSMPLLTKGEGLQRVQGDLAADRHDWQKEHALFNLICEGRY